MTICIIPARAGSTRIPNKNTNDFLGRPIIEHAILTAQVSQLFDDVIVTTDDEKAIAIAKRNKATVIRRPDNLCDDSTSTKTVIAHAIEEIGCQHSEPVCCLYATAAFTTPKILTETYKLIVSSNDAAFVMTAVEYAHPIERALHLMKDGHVMPRNSSPKSSKPKSSAS